MDAQASDRVDRGVVLVVDDDEECRTGTRDVLLREGYSVIDAANGREALSFLLSHVLEDLRVIILDLRMPHMSGWELLKILQSYIRFSRIPVVVMSGAPYGADSPRAIVDWLQKPFGQDQLLAAVARSVGQTASVVAATIETRRAPLVCTPLENDNTHSEDEESG